MDKKKKMMVAVVGIAMAGVLILILGSLFTGGGDRKANAFSSSHIKIPEVNMDKIKKESKLASYEAESKKKAFEVEVIKAEKVELNSNENSDLSKILELQKLEEEKQKKFLEKLQNQYRNSNNDSFKAEAFRRRSNNSNAKEPKEELSKEEQEALLLSGGAFNGAGFHSSNTNRFYGAPTVDTKGMSKNLIPAEIVDRTLVTQGSTVAIRLHESAYIQKLGVTIPKDAVLYAVANFSSATRLKLTITSYKHKNVFYQTKFAVYDFDGRIGIHLDNNSWPKIPGKVAKDVANVALQRAQAVQQNAIGGQAAEPLTPDQAKDLAVISGARYVTDELFLKQKVLLPRQYNVWLDIGK